MAKRKYSTTDNFTPEERIDFFNKCFPVGSKVLHRNIGIKEYPFKERIVASSAFKSKAGEPIVFFENLSGYYSILPEFVKYSDFLDEKEANT